MLAALVAVSLIASEARLAQALHGYLGNAAGAELARLKKVIPHGERAFLFGQIAARLEDDQAHRIPLSPAEVRNTVVDYELFKYRAFLSSGVFPKRYFGYFDLKGDTAARERELQEVVRAAAAVIDRHQAARGASVRVSHAEIAVTWLAEGGAMLLRERQDLLDEEDPIHHIGLDDVRTGFGAYPKLVEEMDAALGTDLRGVVGGGGLSPLNLWRKLHGGPMLRPLTMREGLATTAILFLYEKEIADRKLRDRDGSQVMKLSPDEQFVTASLVYNSGLLFSRERVRQILGFDTARYLAQLSRAARRPPLPVRTPRNARWRVLTDGRYPDQQTSWSAVYHVLQRWGAYRAMQDFTEVFDERGGFR